MSFPIPDSFIAPVFRKPVCAKFAIPIFLLGLMLCGRCGGMTVVPPAFADLVARADRIVRVRVTAVASTWDDPTGPKAIHTAVTFRILRTLKGQSGETLVLRFLGGQVGEVTMAVPGMPVFDVGGTYILFVRRNLNAFCPLVGVMHGSYRVAQDPATGAEHILRSNSEPLRSIADVNTPMDSVVPPATGTGAPAMTRDSFENAILGELGHARGQ